MNDWVNECNKSMNERMNETELEKINLNEFE